jgi:hypothetical protein
VVSVDPIDRVAADIEAQREQLARQAGVEPSGVKPPLDVTAQMAASLGIDFG